MNGAGQVLWAGVRVLLGLLVSFSAHMNHTQARLTDCFPRPSRCGYPDATNTGVPRNRGLSTSRSITVDEDGATLDGLLVRGSVTVAADDVTIEDTRIVQPAGGEGSYAVILNKGADGFTIRDSEVHGSGRRANGLESAVWNHYNNPGAKAIRVHFHGCSDCWEGAGAFRDAYMVVDAAYRGSHDEDVYVCGGAVSVDHSTLVNRHSQTATVFGDAGCGANRFVVTDSLLAGGGFLLYPQANSNSPTGSMRVTGNRFARCSGRPVFDSRSGGTACARGPDAGGLFPHGGYYGVAAYYYRGRRQAWRHNRWDDSLRPVCPARPC